VSATPPLLLSSIRKLLPLLPFVALLTSCQYVPMIPGITPYKIDIQQGNYVTQDMVAKLKPGMSKSQVRFALGTPLVVDAFHNDRWDYIYVLQKGGQVREHRRIIVLFEQDKLLRIEGDVAPSLTGANANADAAALISAPAPSSTPVTPRAAAPTAEPSAEPTPAGEPPAATTAPLQ
jgi:outer membrane protein assembly factor BamE